MFTELYREILTGRGPQRTSFEGWGSRPKERNSGESVDDLRHAFFRGVVNTGTEIGVIDKNGNEKTLSFGAPEFLETGQVGFTAKEITEKGEADVTLDEINRWWIK